MANRKSRKPAARRPSQPRPAGNPARRQPSRPTPNPPAGDTALRTAVAEWSRGPVLWLSLQPQFLIPTVMLALIVVGLLAPVAVAVVALLLVEAFVCWLAFLSWPVLGAGARAIRGVMIAVLLFSVVAQFAGWF